MKVLYHYCSTNSFKAIVETHVVWLSSLSLSNDSMEGKLVASVVSYLAERDGLDHVSTKQLQDMITPFEQIIEGLGFCLSEEGDLLSQWRGYAADATGVSIGFSREYIEWLAEESRDRDKDEAGFSLAKVKYEPEEHKEEVGPIYSKAKQLIEEGALKVPGLRCLLDLRTDEQIKQENKKVKTANSALIFTMLSLFPKLFLLKSPAFREEIEWRLLSYLVLSEEDTCFYRALQDRLIPYRSFQLKQPERQPITEVILGPKHLTPIWLVEHFLRQNGYGTVTVKRSEVTYR